MAGDESDVMIRRAARAAERTRLMRRFRGKRGALAPATEGGCNLRHQMALTPQRGRGRRDTRASNIPLMSCGCNYLRELRAKCRLTPYET